jgi:hypothetical protein
MSILKNNTPESNIESPKKSVEKKWIKNRVNTYVFAIGLSVAAIVGTSTSANSENNNSSVVSNEVAWVQINNSKELIDLLSNFYSMHEVELNKNQLDSLYDEYNSLNIW